MKTIIRNFISVLRRFKMATILNIFGLTVAFSAIHKWLENFAYKTPVYWWVFMLAFLLVFCLTILTVTFQNWRVANENPVYSIKDN